MPEIAWEANGTAVIVRSRRFSHSSFDDAALSDGNHATVFQGIDVLSDRGNMEATHPWSSSSNTNQCWGRIDHITVRIGIGLQADGLDFGVWSIANETARKLHGAASSANSQAGGSLLLINNL